MLWSLAFEISLRDRSLNTLSKGLWSTAIIDQVAAAQYKESGFIEGVSNSEGLPFHQGIARFSSMCEAASNKCNFPTCAAAEGFSRGAMTVFLEEPESYACFRPICG